MTAPGFALSSHSNLREGTDCQRRRQARARAEVRTASRRGRRERMALSRSGGRDSRTSAAAPGNERRGLCRGGAASIFFDDSDSRPLLSAPKNKKGFSSELIRSEGMPPHPEEQEKPAKRTSMDDWIRRRHGRRTDAGGDGERAQPSSSLLLCWNRSAVGRNEKMAQAHPCRQSSVLPRPIYRYLANPQYLSKT